MRLRAEKVGVGCEAEERTRGCRGATAEILVVGRRVIVTEHETRVTRQVCIDPSEHVGERILFQNPRAVPWVGEALRLQLVLEGGNSCCADEAVGAAEERAC